MIRSNKKVAVWSHAECSPRKTCKTTAWPKI